jgi:hypothetical protein
VSPAKSEPTAVDGLTETVLLTNHSWVSKQKWYVDP